MKHKLIFKENIKRWDEAIPLGNGRIGSLIWGEPTALRFSLDRTDIWDLSVPMNTERKEFCYKNLVRLAKEKKTQEIRELFDAPYNYPTPTKLPAGKLIFDFKNMSKVKSVLDLQIAEAELDITGPSECYKVYSFCHAVSKTGMIKIGTTRDKFSVKLLSPQFGSQNEKEEVYYNPKEREISQGGLEKLHYSEAVRGEANGAPSFLWFTQEVDERFSYGIVAGVLEKEQETLVFYRIITSNDGENWLEDAKMQLKEELLAGYEISQREHRIWWKRYWEKSKVMLPDSLFEKQWYVTNYLFASCSRKGSYPMPLQGVWTADDGNLPPWKGDYHHDLNTQFSYTHFYKANHLEEGESFIDFLWDSMGAARKFAKVFYETDGICLPGVMTIDGKPLGGWPMYSLSPVHQIWLCQSFELYYRYTGDETFLRERAWIYFEETAKCITSLLEEGEDGYYYLPVSSSPEIHDDEAEAWVTPNSNYDLALLRYLYAMLIEFSDRLENGQKEKWENVMKKLPHLAVNEKNVLMISPDESLEESHRHLSNAMAICPLYLYRYDNEEEKEIIDAVVEDYERLGTGMWVGFSFAWMAHLYAIQKNGEGAFDRLRIFWESFCSVNGFHLNGDYKKRGYTTFHYRPFTLEANMYAADALQEMLMQMHDGVIELFPAVPQKWKDEQVGFEGFRGEKGILISAKMKNSDICEVQLKAQHEQSVLVKIGKEKKVEVYLKAGETKYITL